ncbi:MAG: DUF6783 domain-containing protein [Blautia sp.]
MRTKSPTNCDAHLAESLFQTRSSTANMESLKSLSVVKCVCSEKSMDKVLFGHV